MSVGTRICVLMYYVCSLCCVLRSAVSCAACLAAHGKHRFLFLLF